MKGLIADYSDDSDSGEETKKEETKRKEEAKIGVKSDNIAANSDKPRSDQSLKQIKRAEPEKPIVQISAAANLLGNAEKTDKEAEDADSDLSDGDFVKKAKKVKTETEQQSNANATKEKSASAPKPDVEGLDPIARSLFSVLPPPKNKRLLNPVVMQKMMPKGNNSANQLIKDEGDNDFLLTYNNVQMPKAEIKYSTTISATKTPACKSTLLPKEARDDHINEGDIIEINEREMRDDNWKMNYIKGAADDEQDQAAKMEQYLQDHPVGKEERSKNQITHLAYQAMKQQMSQRYENVQRSQKDGRKKYGW